MKIPLSVLALLFTLSAARTIEAQTQTPAPHVPRGAATDVANAEIKAAVQKTASSAVSDQQLRVVSINGEYSGPIQNGASRKIGPGDIVIIPPNTPHWFSEITSDQIVYLVVRIDPHKVLPAGYGAK